MYLIVDYCWRIGQNVNAILPLMRLRLFTAAVIVLATAAGAHAAVSTSAIGRGTAGAGPTASARAAAGTTSSSTREFHASHPPHRPAHFGSAAPHSLHRKIVLGRAMA